MPNDDDNDSKKPPAAVPGYTAQTNSVENSADLMTPPAFAATTSRAAAATAVANEHLSQIERDVMEKAAAGRMAAPAMRPGVSSVYGGGAGGPASAGLSVYEQDVAAKEAARAGPPAFVSATTSGNQFVTNESLNQIEQDILSKSSVGRNQASTPGVTASFGGPPPTSGLVTLQSDADVKRQAAFGRSEAPQPGTAAASLNSFESNVVDKAFGGTTTATATATTNPSTTAPSTRDLQSQNSASYLGDDVVAKIAASQSAAYERPIEHQSTSYAAAPAPNPPSLYPAVSSNMFTDMAAMDTFRDLESDIPGKSTTRTPDIPVTQNADFTTVESSFTSSPPAQHETHSTYDHEAAAATTYETAQVTPYIPPESAAVYNSNVYGTDDIAGAATGGIEAFVAATVVDATGVEVVKSDEEEARSLWKRQKRQFICIGMFVVVVVIVIAVSVVVTTGKKHLPPPIVIVPTAAPSVAPSNMPSLPPTTADLTLVLQDLAAVSDPAALKNKSTPQYKAAFWISNENNYVQSELQSGKKQKFFQRYILAVMYYSLGGNSWTQCGQLNTACKIPNATNWLSASDECTWLNLGCNSAGLLTSFNFVQSTDYREKGANMLRGTLVPETVFLTELNTFVAYSMQLQGSIAGHFSNASNLASLVIANNAMTGSIPENIGTENSALTTLTLSGNKLIGSIPSSISTLTTLTDLELADNQLTGTITSQLLSSLTNLQTLSLSGNSFVGDPFSFALALTNLQLLKLDSNNFRGTISTNIGQLSQLSELWLGGTEMYGTLPTHLFDLQSINTLKLFSANFTGTLPTEIGLLNQTLNVLDVSNNDMTGSIPVAALDNCNQLETLFLYGNKFSGTISTSDALCQNRGSASGQLSNFIVSCTGVNCACCNACMN